MGSSHGASTQVVQYVPVETAPQEPIVQPAVAKNVSRSTEGALAVSREFYPLGVAGWERGVESLADKCFHDEDHRLLTTVPITTARKAAAGMLQNLTSKGQPWYYLTVPKNLTDKLSKEKRGVLEKLTEASRYLMARSAVIWHPVSPVRWFRDLPEWAN